MNITLRNIAALFIVTGLMGILGACSLIGPSNPSHEEELDVTSSQLVSGLLPACNPALLITNDQVFDTLYAIAFNRDIDEVQLKVIDPLTAQTLARQTITSTDGTMTNATGLAADPLTGVLWALVQFQGMSGNRSLVTLDPIAGTATLIGHLGDAFAEIAFDACGRLFGVTGDGATNSETLYLIDKSDASIKWLRELGNGSDGEVIAINPFSGLIYHASGFFSAFETVNITNGTTSSISLSGEFFGELNSLAFGLGGAGLYATNIGGILYNISTSGFSLLIGQIDNILFSERTHGLAFAPATLPLGDPEPVGSGSGDSEFE